jgi:lipoprotein-releasing system permease protein
VSLLSVLGIAIGVASLLLLQAFAAGFTETIHDNLMAFHPPIVAFAPGGHMLGPEEIEEVSTAALQIRGVTSVSASLEKTAVASGGAGRISGVLVRGVSWSEEAGVTRLSELTGLDSIRRRVVIGSGLSEKLLVEVGETIRLASTESARVSGAGTALLDTILTLEVAGIVDFGLEEFNSGMIMTDIGTAAVLFGFDMEFASFVGIGLEPGTDPVAVSEDIATILRDRYVSSGMDLYVSTEAFIARHSNLFRALGLERLAMTIVLALITVVALLNLSSALTMIALEHRRDSGVMRAMGAPPGFILRLSLLQGFLISSIGALAGAVLALAGVWLVNSLFPIRLEASVYWVDSLPATLKASWFLVALPGTVVAGLLASVLPAIKSLSMTPAEAVRYE